MASAPLLRIRLRRTMAAHAVIAVLLFGIPLSVAVQRVLEGQALSSLQRDATRALATVPDNTLQSGTQVAVPAPIGSTHFGLYDAVGVKVAGHGPARSGLASHVTDGKEHDGHEVGEVVVVAPVISDTTVAGSVRAAFPISTIQARVAGAWAGLLALAALALAVTTLLASRAARLIAEPFEQITNAARALGAGARDLGLPRWGIAEADAAGEALQASAHELHELVRHEREFVRHASHQLRTPLAGLIAQLELLDPDTHPEVHGLIGRAQDLDRTINDLIAVRRPAARETCEVLPVIDEAVVRWQATTPREVVMRFDEVDRAAMPAAALRQALDILLDNGLRHGHGRVTVTVEPLGDNIVVEVTDEGSGFAEDTVHGTGLRLAAGLVERFGGSLLMRRATSHPRVALLLPAQSTAKR